MSTVSNAYHDSLHNSRTAAENDIRDQNILANGSYELHCVLVLKKLIIFVFVTMYYTARNYRHYTILIYFLL
jgi:hypothetical protein